MPGTVLGDLLEGVAAVVGGALAGFVLLLALGWLPVSLALTGVTW